MITPQVKPYHENLLAQRVLLGLLKKMIYKNRSSIWCGLSGKHSFTFFVENLCRISQMKAPQ
jgi:hypothetical protein